MAALFGPVPAGARFEYENPALDAVIEELAAAHTGGDERQLGELAGEAREYVTSTVASCLDRPAPRLDHLALVVDASRDAEHTVIATLNHDTVLEQALRQYGVWEEVSERIASLTRA